MKLSYLSIALLLCVVLVMGATPRKTQRSKADRQFPGNVQTGTEIDIVASDTSMAPASAGAWEMLTRQAFTLLPASDTLRVKSDSAVDSIYITLYGMRASDSANVQDVIRVTGKADTAFGSVKFLKGAFEAAVLDSLNVGTVAIYSKTGGTLTTILPGQRQTLAAVHFTGRTGSGVKYWSVEGDTLNGAEVELRFYPYWLDLMNNPSTASYVSLDKSRLRRNATLSPEAFHEFSPLQKEGAPIQLERLGALAIFGKGTVTTRIYNARMSVYDRTQ